MRSKVEVVSYVKKMGREFHYRRWGEAYSKVETDCKRLVGHDPAKLKSFERKLKRFWVEAMPPDEQQGRRFWDM